jgi:hypothetical protein
LLVAPGAYPRRKHLKGPPIGFALALPSNSKTQLERVTTGKPSSLLGLVISDEEINFYNIATWCQSFRNFFQQSLIARTKKGVRMFANGKYFQPRLSNVAKPKSLPIQKGFSTKKATDLNLLVQGGLL